LKSKIVLLFFLLVLSCQGPWSYYPENPERYVGIWTNAYIISGRPVEKETVCFDKMHALNEVRMPGFAFYDEASVIVKGVFSGAYTELSLEPQSGRPNCFVGPEDLLAEAGENYELNVSIAWDSAGKKVTSSFNAKTYIPQKFKIIRGYDLKGKEFKEGETIQYLPPPQDMKAVYFIPEYSDDVAGTQVSMIYGDGIYWGESTISGLIGQFRENGADTAFYAKFGSGTSVYFARNEKIAGSQNEMDSIPIIGMQLPAVGEFMLRFYATTGDYVKYRNTYINGDDDSRVQAVYNINGGAGIFAGMLVDSFQVFIESLSDIEIYPHKEAQNARCRELSRDYNIENYKYRRQCVEIWDKIIWCEIDNGRPKDGSICLWNDDEERKWYDIPSEEMQRLLSYSEFITWCEHRDFPIDLYPLCGTAMVSFSKTGKNSAILDREVKKWCAEHKTDPEC